MIRSSDFQLPLGLPAAAMLVLVGAAEASLLALPTQAAGAAAFQPDCLKARGVAPAEAMAGRFESAAAARSGPPLLLAQRVVGYPACTYTPYVAAPEPAVPIRGLW
jgi:hypothetical protein